MSHAKVGVSDEQRAVNMDARMIAPGDRFFGMVGVITETDRDGAVVLFRDIDTRARRYWYELEHVQRIVLYERRPWPWEAE